LVVEEVIEDDPWTKFENSPAGKLFGGEGTTEFMYVDDPVIELSSPVGPSMHLEELAKQFIREVASHLKR